MRYEIAWAVSKIICVLILFAITMYAGYSIRLSAFLFNFMYNNT